MSELVIRRPYLLFLGDAPGNVEAKTAMGIAHWRPDECVGQLRLPGAGADTGLPDMSIDAAVNAGARSLLIGVASVGGGIREDWIPTLCDALESSLDVVSGMHVRLASVPPLVKAAEHGGTRLVDVRVPPPGIPVGTGKPRGGKRVLTVGTDCAVGKKYTALALDRALREAGVDATFRATGQTGILIAGAGIPMDAVVADFVSGAAEMLSPANDPQHWDVIEGQGSLFHPGYAAVTLGLVHGSQPDAMVLCHAAGRTAIEGFPGYAIAPLAECIERYEQAARLTRPGARCVGVSVNTDGLRGGKREAYLERVTDETGLPTVDPLATGVTPLVEALEAIPGRG